MIFFRFVRACRKYKFTFILNTYGGLSLILRPNDTFENIKLEERYIDYYKILLNGIKEMKKYRKKRGY